MSDIRIQTLRQPDCTLGVLTVGGFRCFTLELPDKDNANGVSCIPAGTYRYFKRVSPSNGNVLELRDVPNRTHIQIHKGNYTRNVLGCILVGKTIADIDSDGIPDVTASGVTLNELLALVDAEGTVTIERL